MSDLSNIKNLSLDKLIAEIGDKRFSVTGLTLHLQLNAPGTCELVLAQGESVRGSLAAGATSSTLSSSSFDAYTKVVVNLYMQGKSTPIVLFRGVVSSVSRIAAKNVAGSYAGIVVNCVMPQILMSTYSMNGYRYWGSAADSRGQLTALSNFGQSLVLEQLGTKKPLSTIYTDAQPVAQFADDFAEYITTATGIMVAYITDERFSENSVEVHFERRDRKVVASSALAGVSFKADENFVRSIIGGLKRADPFTVLRSIYTQQLFMNMVPMPCGKMDTIPAFPWSKETVGKLRRGDILQMRDTTALSAAVENLDAVLVPIMFNADFNTSYAQWPETDAQPAGTFKIVNVPSWLSPYMDSVETTTIGQADRNKTNKATKDTKENIDERNEQYEVVAKLLAKAFFAQLKNGGVALEATVPWYRLEFLDALGYLMEIEQPIFDRQEQRKNLYGFLNGAVLKVQSTPGGSKASMQLSFTHVRDKTVHDEFALAEHPLFSISGGPASAIKSFLSNQGRVFTRSQQETLEGGGHEGYLDEAIAEVRNRK